MDKRNMIDKRVYCKHEGQGVYAEYFQEVSKKQCEEYCGQLEKDGFVLHEEHWLGENTFYTYVKEKDINFVSYYPNVQSILIWTHIRSGIINIFQLLCDVSRQDFGPVL